MREHTRNEGILSLEDTRAFPDINRPPTSGLGGYDTDRIVVRPKRPAFTLSHVSPVVKLFSVLFL